MLDDRAPGSGRLAREEKVIGGESRGEGGTKGGMAIAAAREAKAAGNGGGGVFVFLLLRTAREDLLDLDGDFLGER